MEKQLEQYKFDLMKAGALLIQTSHKASNNTAIRSHWEELNNFICEYREMPESVNSWRKKLAKLRKNLQNEIERQDDTAGLVHEANKLSELAYSNMAIIVDAWNN